MCHRIRKIYRCAHTIQNIELCAKVPEAGYVLCKDYNTFPRMIMEKCPQCSSIEDAKRRQAVKELEKEERDARTKERPERGCLRVWLWW
jgi:hypothetical protein